MKVRINGQLMDEPVKRMEIKEEASDAAGLAVIALGVVACVLWWSLWL